MLRRYQPYGLNRTTNQICQLAFCMSRTNITTSMTQIPPMPRIHLYPTQRTTVTNPLSFPVHQNQSRSIFILGSAFAFICCGRMTKRGRQQASAVLAFGFFPFPFLVHEPPNHTIHTGLTNYTCMGMVICFGWQVFLEE
jgi:hypothetical protein